MDLYNYNQYTMAQQQELEDKKKAEELKQRLMQFTTVSTLKDAKELAEKIIPTTQELTVFYSGSAKCSVVNRANMLRISIETAEDFICYDFT